MANGSPSQFTRTISTWNVNDWYGADDSTNSDATSRIQGQTIETGILAGADLQNAYDSGANPAILLSSARGAIDIKDAATPTGGNFLQVTNNAGSNIYWKVSASGPYTEYNFTFNGASQRILGDWDGTATTGTWFKNVNTNSSTVVTATPNGTSDYSGWRAVNTEATSFGYVEMNITSTEAAINSAKKGLASTVNLEFQLNSQTKFYLDATTGYTTFADNQRMRVDANNAGSFSSRFSFQARRTNENMYLGVIPNGTGTGSAYVVSSSSDPDNASTGLFFIDEALGYVTVDSVITGTGTLLPLKLRMASSDVMTINTSGDIEFASNMTAMIDGFDFKDSNSNQNTYLNLIPNGTATESAYICYGSADKGNSSYGVFSCNETSGYISVDTLNSGTGALYPLSFNISGTRHFELKTTGVFAESAGQTNGIEASRIETTWIEHGLATTGISANVTATMTFATAAGITLTIQSAHIAFPGRIFKFKDKNNNASVGSPITIATQGSETIEGASTLDITLAGDFVELTSDGSNLYITG